jgi:hypothetical protein
MFREIPPIDSSFSVDLVLKGLRGTIFGSVHSILRPSHLGEAEVGQADHACLLEMMILMEGRTQDEVTRLCPVHHQRRQQLPLD